MHVVILGCGRVGARVAGELDRRHSVSVIDWKESAFDRLPPDFSGSTVYGNGIDTDTLRAAGAERADLFLALTDTDNRNLMTAQVARALGTKRVFARVYDPVRAEAFRVMDIETLSPTVNAAESLYELVTAP